MRPQSKLLLANELRLQHPWWQLERALTREAQWQRISRLASKPHYQDLITGLDWHTYRQVRELLHEDEPPVAAVMRDLGIDHQAAGIQPVAMWGVERQGLAPRYRAALRQALHWRTGGLLGSTYHLRSNRYLDPADQVVIHHIRALHSLVQPWPPDQLPYLEKAWSQTQQQLQTKAHPWYTVKGPMAAAIVYLQEWHWQVQTCSAGLDLTRHTLNLRDPWWKLEQALLNEARQQRTS